MSLFNGTITMKTMNILEKGLDTALLRRQVLANNMANVSVPNFKRSEVAFESEMKRAIDSEKVAREQPAIRANNPRHMTQFLPRDFSSVRAKVHVDYISKMRNDGNNVDLEDETSKNVRNQLQYNLMVNRMGASFRQLNQLLRLA